jgi:hypothetical protein
MTENIEANFAGMQTELRLIENIYNPEGKNLHFELLTNVDSELLEKLLCLSNQAIAIVKNDAHRYSRNTSYSHDMFYFWYDYFLIINALSKRVMDSVSTNMLPIEIIKGLVDNLIEISEFSTIVLGDLYIRNYEALGNSLVAFYSSELMVYVKSKKDSITSESVTCFLEGTIKRVDEIMSTRK